MLNDLDKAARWLDEAQALIICAGAGIGVDSGLPDFRGQAGFWQAYPALAAAKLSFDAIANPASFTNDPRLAWGFYGHRLQLYRETVPHAGFDKLKRWAASKPGGAWIYTSNVDGQFERAGFAADQIEECHGSIHHLQCCRPCSQEVHSAAALLPEIDAEHCRWLGDLPRCASCGDLLRPNILMFGDWQWLDQREQAQQARRQAWFEQIETQGLQPLIIEIGAGTDLPTVRRFATKALQRFSSHHARLLRINPRESQVTGDQAMGLAMGAQEALEGIARRLRT